MKLFIFVLVFSCVSLSGQVTWPAAFEPSEQTAIDSVVQGPSNIPNIAAYNWSATISSSGLDTSVTIKIGGSNNKVNLNFYAFELKDSIVFFEDSNMIVTNLDTTYQKTIYGSSQFGNARPLILFDKDSAKVGTVNVDMLFYK